MIIQKTKWYHTMYILSLRSHVGLWKSLDKGKFNFNFAGQENFKISHTLTALSDDKAIYIQVYMSMVMIMSLIMVMTM